MGSVYSPCYLVKRAGVVALFALSAAIAGVVQDPKFFRLLAESARTHALSIAMMTVMLVLLLAMSFALVWTILDARYAVRRQATWAALLFLLIFVIASLAGFWCRALFVPEAGTIPPTFGAHNVLVSSIVLAFGGASAAALYSLLFVQKADYTKFRVEVRTLVSLIEGMREAYKRLGYMQKQDADQLLKACRVARDSAKDLAKADTPSYRAFVEESFAQPLAVLTDAAETQAVQDAPESFLRACGLLDSGRAEEQMSTALRLLQNRS